MQCIFIMHHWVNGLVPLHQTYCTMQKIPFSPRGVPLQKKKKVTRKWLLTTEVQFSSVAQSCLILCDPMDCSTPGLPVHHPAFTQTHVHWVGDAIQPSHPLSSPSPPVFNLSQHQGLFQQQRTCRQMYVMRKNWMQFDRVLNH